MYVPVSYTHLYIALLPKEDDTVLIYRYNENGDDIELALIAVSYTHLDVYKRQIIMVTHNMQQAARISDKTAFFLLGEMVEMDSTEKIFSMPTDKRTEDYITGRFG